MMNQHVYDYMSPPIMPGVRRLGCKSNEPDRWIVQDYYNSGDNYDFSDYNQDIIKNCVKTKEPRPHYPPYGFDSRYTNGFDSEMIEGFNSDIGLPSVDRLLLFIILFVVLMIWYCVRKINKKNV
jgi:hypothetical protein